MKKLLPMTAPSSRMLDPAYFGNHSARHCGAGMMTAGRRSAPSRRGGWTDHGGQEGSAWCASRCRMLRGPETPR
jgi:hypothetical protein